MGVHLIDGEFQSDKYPTCPAGKVPLSAKDPTAQDLLWEYAQRRRAVDPEFADDLEAALKAKGYEPDGLHPAAADSARAVHFYERDFYVLSNFSAFRLRWAGVDFDTSEAAYHWCKFPVDDQRWIREAIRAAPSAHEAFKLAEKHHDRVLCGWPARRVAIMRAILRAKVEQHEYVRRKLLATGDRLLIEDSWRDDFWGWGPNRDGQNMLGKLWMEIRAELRRHA